MLQTATGANNEVVFTLKLEADSGYQAALNKIKEAAIKTQQDIWRGFGGGPPGSSSAGTTTTTRSGSPASHSDSISRMRAMADAQVRAESDVRREIEKTSAARRVSNMQAIEGAKLLTNGVVQAARAFMLLGVSSEENLEKAVRAFAKFEAIAHAATGAMSVAQGGARLLGAAGVGITAGGVAAASGVGLAAGGLLYGLDKLTGVTAAHDRHAAWGERWAALEGERRNLGSLELMKRSAAFDASRYATGSSVNSMGFENRSLPEQQRQVGSYIGALRDMRFDAGQGMRYASNEGDRREYARQMQLLSHDLMGAYDKQYTLKQKEMELVRQTGERSLEYATRVTAQLENQLGIEQEKLRIAVRSRDDSFAAYADLRPSEQAKAQLIAGKIERGGPLDRRDRELARRYGFGDDARASALAEANRMNILGTSYGRMQNRGVAAADRSINATDDLLTASTNEVSRQKESMVESMKQFGDDLKAIADAFDSLRSGQFGYGNLLEARKNQAVRDAARAGG